MKENILITGGSGLLALNWALAIREKSNVTLGLHDRKINLKGARSILLDLDSKEALTQALEALEPQLVIHTAGLTSIEQCEANPTLAKYINVDITKNLVMVCAKLNIPMVYISTDHLFSGNESLIDEDCPVSPINVYAKTKAEAEACVLDSDAKALIIRTNFYGWGTSYRQSSSDMVINHLRACKKISLFKDIYYTPILIEPLVYAVHELVQKKAKGIFNVVGDDRISKYDFGLRLAKAFNLDNGLIDEGKIIDRPSLVNRPHDMSLSNEKVTNFLGVKMGGLDVHIPKLKAQEVNGLAKELQAL
ncbi:RfbD dTDP-4-dehydrorhamnose reductase [Candidatus Methylopumilus universalis]|uniref:SDR family oxidoreductase n=1 Tax=Candidatus Methylopumilus universalis TaxID=2588536 RepID=UPI003BEF31C4